MPELTDYERGARDMRERVAAWLDAGAKRVLAIDDGADYGDIVKTIQSAARWARDIPLTPPARPETESGDGE